MTSFFHLHIHISTRYYLLKTLVRLSYAKSINTAQFSVFELLLPLLLLKPPTKEEVA